jgi:hypothetical protein
MSGWRRFSRLPQSPEYWQRVTARMQQSVQAVGEAPDQPMWSLAPLAWTAIAATIVAVIASAALPDAASGTNLSLRNSLAPADSAAAGWLDSSRPPSASDLLLTQLARAR